MGLTHLDAGVVIGLLDAHDAHHAAARAFIDEALAGNDRLGIAASALAECLVAPSRRRQEGKVLSAIERLPVTVVDLDAPIALEAARLRARHRSLRLPDALVIATAAVSGAHVLATTDRRWPAAAVLGLESLVRV